LSDFLKVEKLNVKFGAIHALKGLDFNIQKGEIVSLIGANGAGKTTTLSAISGLVSWQGGVAFEGSSLAGLKPHEIVKLGLSQSPEGRGVFSPLSVLENLEMGAYTRKDKTEIAQDLENCFELFPRLKERIKQTAGTLSGGEQQMLAISRALMSRPKLLLLDEPSLGLAPLIVQQIFDIIKRLNQSGMTVLLVEQNARMALKISNRAYVVETGRITLSGTGADLLSNPDVQKAYLGG
jgi:branched-chain amino acid transport system ATP-binding protein